MPVSGPIRSREDGPDPVTESGHQNEVAPPGRVRLHCRLIPTIPGKYIDAKVLLWIILLSLNPCLQTTHLLV